MAKQRKYFDKKGNGKQAPQPSQYINIIVSSKLKMKISVNFWLGLQNKIVIISCHRIATTELLVIRRNAFKSFKIIDELHSNGLKFPFALYSISCVFQPRQPKNIHQASLGCIKFSVTRLNKLNFPIYDNDRKMNGLKRTRNVWNFFKLNLQISTVWN